MILGGWRYIAASVIGTSHENTGSTCQDANRCQTFPAPGGGEVLAAAVADGAGSAICGAEGAAITCRALMDLVSKHVTAGKSIEQVSRDTANSWISTIQHILDQEAESAGRERRDFACTVLGVVICESCTACLQVGDGVIVLSQCEANTYGHVFWPDRGEYANTTHFVTENDSAERLHFESAQRRVVEAALLTDGLQSIALDYQKQVAHEPFFRGLFRPLRSAAEGGLEQLSGSLATFLRSPRVNEKTDDDKTLVLASRWFDPATPCIAV